MARLYGRSFRRERCHDSTPCGHWATITALSSIRLDGTTECVVFKGAIDRKIFDEYVKNILTPSLCPGDIVVMDNLPAYKSQDAYNAIREKRADVLFLPAYSPDFNPIEKIRSKVKQILRGIKARTREDLFAGIGKTLELVSANHTQGWFKSCGYTQF